MTTTTMDYSHDLVEELEPIPNLFEDEDEDDTSSSSASSLDEDDVTTIYITKEMDWLPPRPVMPGTRCFNFCFFGGRDDVEEDEDEDEDDDPSTFVVNHKGIPVEEQDTFSYGTAMTMSESYPAEDDEDDLYTIPNLDLHSSLEQQNRNVASSSPTFSASPSWSNLQQTANGFFLSTFLPSPKHQQQESSHNKNTKEVSELLLRLCQVLFSLVVTNATVATTKKHKKKHNISHQPNQNLPSKVEWRRPASPGPI